VSTDEVDSALLNRTNIFMGHL